MTPKEVACKASWVLELLETNRLNASPEELVVILGAAADTCSRVATHNSLMQLIMANTAVGNG